MTMADYWESDELKELAEDLIANAHPYLASAKIAYLFKDKASRKNLTLDGETTQVIPGNFTKMGAGKYELLTKKDLVLEFGYDIWQEYSVAQRRYWVDTLLSGITGEEDDKGGDMHYWSIPYPIAFYPDVIKRNGLVLDELRDAYQIMKAVYEEDLKGILRKSVTPTETSVSAESFEDTFEDQS